MRKILNVLGILIVIFIVALAVCIRPVDWTEITDTEYYNNTISRLNQQSAPLASSEQLPLSVGWGKAEITPPVGVPLAGYGARKGHPSTGVHDRLYVRIIALQTQKARVFIVGYDALLLNPPLARELEDSIRARFSLTPGQFLFTSTHTHSGPGGWGHSWFERQFAGPTDNRVETIFRDSTLAAVERSIKSIAPAEYAYGKCSAPQLVRNRLVGDKGEIDPEFIFLILKQANQIGAIFATYSAHATVLSDNNMLISGDYPGYWERKVEKEIADLALFAVAGLGSHAPRGKGQGFERAQYIGEALADSIQTHLNRLDYRSSADLRYLRLPIDMGSLQIRISDRFRLAPWLAKKILRIKDSYFQAVALDNFLILGNPGEFSGELALEVKHYSAQRDIVLTIISFNGSYLGYITPPKYYHLNEYETRLMSFYGPYTGEYFVEVMEHIINHLGNGGGS